MYEKITGDNVVMFAIKHYDNPQSEGEKEFQDDLNTSKDFYENIMILVFLKKDFY